MFGRKKKESIGERRDRSPETNKTNCLTDSSKKKVEARVIVGKCEHSKKLYGIRIQKMEDGDWYRTWRFPLTRNEAQAEGYGADEIESCFCSVAGYNSCPHCGSNNDFYCSDCGKWSCSSDQSSTHTCPWCGSLCTSIVKGNQIRTSTNSDA